MLAKLIIVIATGFFLGGVLHAAALVVLLLIWTQVPAHDGPPVLKLALTAQWAQATIGLFYSRVTGERFPVMDARAYEFTVLISLGCVLALALGLTMGIRWAMTKVPEVEDRPEELVTFNTVLVVYVASIFITSVLTELSFVMPAIRQVLAVLVMGRLAVVALVMRRLMTPRPQWVRVAGLIAVEVLLGFTGYFSGFKEPLFLFALFLLETFDTREVKHWIAIVLAAVLLGGTLVMWMGVRTEYRRDFDDQLYAESRVARLQRMNALFTDWTDSRNTAGGTGGYDLIDRVWAIYYPALAIDRVPRILPHTNGAIMGAALLHSVTPRFLFPDKAALLNDSDLVRKYSGVWVAGTEEGTSIAFGYVAESYLDFGAPLLFLPVLVFGAVLGVVFVYLLRGIRHRELAIALVVCVYWYNLYLFEKAWAKLIGTGVAMLIYLGGIAFLVDRYVLTEKGRRAASLPGLPAYPDR